MYRIPIRRWSLIGAVVVSAVGFGLPAAALAQPLEQAGLVRVSGGHHGLRLDHFYLPSLRLNLHWPIHHHRGRHHDRFDRRGDDHARGRGRGRGREHNSYAAPRSQSYDRYRPRHDRRDRY